MSDRKRKPRAEIPKVGVAVRDSQILIYSNFYGKHLLYECNNEQRKDRIKKNKNRKNLNIFEKNEWIYNGRIFFNQISILLVNIPRALVTLGTTVLPLTSKSGEFKLQWV